MATGHQSPQTSLLSRDRMEAMGKDLIQLCDQLEQHGLVDYQMGIWEEEILSGRWIILFYWVWLCLRLPYSHSIISDILPLPDPILMLTFISPKSMFGSDGEQTRTPSHADHPRACDCDTTTMNEPNPPDPNQKKRAPKRPRRKDAQRENKKSLNSFPKLMPKSPPLSHPIPRHQKSTATTVLVGVPA